MDIKYLMILFLSWWVNFFKRVNYSRYPRRVIFKLNPFDDDKVNTSIAKSFNDLPVCFCSMSRLSCFKRGLFKYFLLLIKFFFLSFVLALNVNVNDLYCRIEYSKKELKSFWQQFCKTLILVVNPVGNSFCSCFSAALLHYYFPSTDDDIWIIVLLLKCTWKYWLLWPFI